MEGGQLRREDGVAEGLMWTTTGQGVRQQGESCWCLGALSTTLSGFLCCKSEIEDLKICME